MSRRQVIGSLVAVLAVLLVAYLTTQGLPAWVH